MLLFTSNFFSQFFNLFDVTPRAPFATGTTTTWDKFQTWSFSLLVFVCCNCLFFPDLSTQSFCPQAQQYQWGDTFFQFCTAQLYQIFFVEWYGVWILKSHNILTLSFSTALAGLWLYHWTLSTKPNFWHNSKCTILAISCLSLYSFWARYIHSAIKWVIDSPLYPHILHFSGTSWPSMFFPIHVILRACSCVANIKSSVSFFR